VVFILFFTRILTFVRFISLYEYLQGITLKMIQCALFFYIWHSMLSVLKLDGMGMFISSSAIHYNLKELMRQYIILNTQLH